MRYLTTPWRMKYVVGTAECKTCVFCDLVAGEKSDEEGRIIARGREAFLILNAYPYTPGHMLALPYRHVGTIGELTPIETDEMFRFALTAEQLLRRVYGCRSVHLGANLGRAAGAGVPGHVHYHIVAWPAGPLLERWSGAETPPESLAETYSRLRGALGGS